MQLLEREHRRLVVNKFTHEQVFKIVGAVFTFELLNVEQRAAAFQGVLNGDNLPPLAVRTEKPTGKGVMTDVDFHAFGGAGASPVNDLDVIGANYNTTRLTITPADDSTIPPTPAVMESDTDYRLRIQQAFEGLSVAGSVGAYQYHGRSADGRVADISVTSPSPACVTISVLSRENNGVASEDLLAVVRNALNGEDVRPVADRVTVQSAAIVEYQINATLYLYPGPESEPIRAAAVKKLEAYITAQHRLGRNIRLSAIYAALHVEGVQRVELTAPLADIVLNSTQASFCTEYRVVTGGSDE